MHGITPGRPPCVGGFGALIVLGLGLVFNPGAGAAPLEAPQGSAFLQGKPESPPQGKLKNPALEPVSSAPLLAQNTPKPPAAKGQDAAAMEEGALLLPDDVTPAMGEGMEGAEETNGPETGGRQAPVAPAHPEVGGHPGLTAFIAHQVLPQFSQSQVALVVYSLRKNKYLYRLRANEQMIPASTAKLLTTYGALSALGANFQWDTRFSVVRRQGSGEEGPLGLLVTGSGDPTLTYADMQAEAAKLRVRGIAQLEDGLLYDGTRYDGSAKPAEWGDAAGDQPWFAPISPFVVNQNTAAFLVGVQRNPALQRGLPPVVVSPAMPVTRLEMETDFSPATGRREIIGVRPLPKADHLAFLLSGRIPNRTATYTVETAVADPVQYYFTLLGQALREAGIGGPMTWKPGQAPAEPEYTWVHHSAPLREVIQQVNKTSYNLGAEALLRAMAWPNKREAITTADGLSALQAALRKEFPNLDSQAHLADGSGLSRENRLTADLLVRLLQKAASRTDFRVEFLASLPLAGWDGTLRYHHFPAHVYGKIRAKSGTLKGVQNLAGVMDVNGEPVLFAFLINRDSRNFLVLQQVQDQALAKIYGYLVGEGRKSAR